MIFNIQTAFQFQTDITDYVGLFLIVLGYFWMKNRRAKNKSQTKTETVVDNK